MLDLYCRKYEEQMKFQQSKKYKRINNRLKRTQLNKFWTQTKLKFQVTNHRSQIQMIKQGFSKDQLQLYGKQYLQILQLIDEISVQNQDILNTTSDLKSEVNTRYYRKIYQLIQILNRINKSDHQHIFYFLLSQSTTLKTFNKTFSVTVFYKFTTSLFVFLKANSNIKTNSSVIWDVIKYYFCYQEKIKERLPQFSKDFRLIERIKDFYASKLEYPFYDALRKFTQENSWLNKLEVQQNWKKILSLNNKIFLMEDQKSQLNSLHNQINKILKVVPSNLLQQIHLNRLKEQYEKQILRVNHKKHPCCSVYFHKNQKIQLNSHHYNEYQDIRCPLKSEGEKNIRKIIISFLNTNGGILYIGLRKEQNHVIAQGVSMNEEQIYKLYKQIYEISLQIYPDNENELPNPPQITSDTYFLELSRFVSVQLNPLIDKSHGNIDHIEIPNQKKNSRLFIVKIKVKTAPKYDTYMVKNSNGPIQSYMRRDNKIQKIKAFEFPKVFYERSEQYINQNTLPRNPQCPYCRHNYAFESQ